MLSKTAIAVLRKATVGNSEGWPIRDQSTSAHTLHEPIAHLPLPAESLLDHIQIHSGTCFCGNHDKR